MRIPTSVIQLIDGCSCALRSNSRYILPILLLHITLLQGHATASALSVIGVTIYLQLILFRKVEKQASTELNLGIFFRLLFEFLIEAFEGEYVNGRNFN